ncbi:FAD dependent oxidoreductase [Nitzschia inconspicua]|uniref:FAD dependent oxidoreductase n=1 Tax=Nitzschia inconspicua TaxID=303405 RepID=A0A9K3LDN4_9STRA|nr:FAD dependent oxidoreductase [Nitzschia inconspicua]
MVAVPNIVIAGGGVVGTSIAYFLANNYDMPVTLIDPVGIAPGASGKAGGFLARDWRDGTPLQDLHRQGFQLHHDIANEMQNQKNIPDIDYRRLTCSAVAIDESAETVQKPRSKKLKDVEWVDENVVMGSMLMGDESSIAQVHPRKFCEALWQTAQTKVGSTLQKGRIVKALLKKSVEDDTMATIQAVELDNGQILPADKLVIACGPWTYEANTWFQDYNENHDASIFIPDITGVKCHSILVKSPKVLSQAVFFEGDGTLGDGDLEVYPRPDGDCYVNGFPDEESVVTERPGEETLDRAALDLLQKAMQQTASKELFQGQSTTIPHTEQVCYWPETIDGLPLLGSLPGVSGAFVATGHSVWGILQGPSTGRAMAELIMEGQSKSLDLESFGLERFQLDETV